ncbi:PREDICTED: cysteine-rich DPF motif domain-containing protein 1 [Sturnus vulgaris]|uniref:cysteine-rich DPF motif domain-containing protein 1 n=1 Tax=Sturnus vulgaris TaxID=9172 RepID=UPI00071A71CC|nr:PREDICTED: cysteine-rich DPF motif domain-containing protein 1 [Sturnus vulgaris]
MKVIPCLTLCLSSNRVATNMTRFCQEPDEGSQFYFTQMQQSEIVQTKKDFCLMRVVGKYLDSACNLRMGAPKEVQTPGEFRCELCELSAPYTYYGQTPPNSTLIQLLEKAYVMKDPITPDKDKFLIVGFHCSLCTRAVCVVQYKQNKLYFCFIATLSKDMEKRWLLEKKGGKGGSFNPYCSPQQKDCSLFYSKSFCLPCVKENLNAFPLEIKEDMDKRKPQQKSCRKNGYKA